MKGKAVLISFLAAVLLLGGLSQIALGQGNPAEGPIWQSVARETIPEPGEGVVEGGDKPVKAHYIELNTAALRQRLETVPLEDLSVVGQTGITVSLPLPNGQFGVFDLLESPIMEQALADKYPDFKSYIGYGVEDETAVTRITFTPYGFNALVNSTEGLVYINPVRDEDNRYYYSYYKNDVPPSVQAILDRHYNTGHVEMTMTEASIVTGDELRTYQLAVAATGEFSQNNGQTVPAVLSVIMGVVNRANLIFQQEAALRMILVANNDQIIFADPATDPFTTTNYFNTNHATIDGTIGNANYDIGHLFRGDGGGGAVGALPAVCITNQKARGFSRTDGSIDSRFDEVFWHEIGHQFGANHSWNGDAGSCSLDQYGATAAYEPGSGSTIMSYAGLCSPQNIVSNPDPFFHTISFEEMTNYTIGGDGDDCAFVETVANMPPVADAGTGGFTIPINTPFTLIGSGTDGDGDPLTYSWEQYDLGPRGAPNSPVDDAPIFRSFTPTTDPSRTFPQISDILLGTQTLGEILPTYDRTLTFRLTVRDGHRGVDYDEMSFNVTSAAGPFRILSPNGGEVINPSSTEIVTWSVAFTNQPPVNCTNVNILRSMDGGQIFTPALTNTPNDGSAAINFPNTSTSQARIKIECANSIFFDISDGNFTVSGTFASVNGLPCNHTSITDAVNAAASGDTIFVMPGSYYETVIINNKDLTIQPATSNCTTPTATGLVTINRLGLTRGMRIFDSVVTLNRVRILNTSGASGAGIDAVNSDITLDNSQIGPFNNSLGRGGGVQLNGGSLMMVNGSSISYNEATTDGGGAYAFNGAVIDLWDTSKIQGNEAGGGSGGGVYLAGASLIMRANSIMLDNHASASGGGIFMENGSSLTAVGMPTLDNNSSDMLGGALFMNGGTSGFVNTLISNNRANNGGAIAATNGANIAVENDSQVLQNSALGANSTGGGVYLDNSNLNLETDTRVVSNTAESGAGIYGMAGSTLNFYDNAEIVANNAVEGGGVYLDNSTLFMWNATNISNNMADNGAGLFAGNGSIVTIRDSARLTKNSAIHGGGVYLDNSNFTMRNTSLVDENVAGGFDGSGGGIYGANGANITVWDSAVVGKPDGSARDGNQAMDVGGGVYLDDSNLTLRLGGLVRSNEAVKDGGGVYMVDGSLTMEDNSRIENNLARDSFGGGVYAEGGANVTLWDSAVIGQLADNGTPNYSHDGAGGLELRDNDTTLTLNNNSQVAYNDGRYGGIYASSLVVVTLNDSSAVRGNFDSNGGTSAGGMRLLFSSLFVNGSAKIIDNLNGDGIDIVPGSATFNGGIISGNDGGCGLDADDMSTIVMTGTQIFDQTSYGLCVDGTTALTNTQITNNYVGVSVGGNAGTSFQMTGGLVSGHLLSGLQMSWGQNTLKNVTIENNFSSACGGFNLGQNGSLIMADSLVQNNNTDLSGGGMCIRGRAWLSNTNVVNNMTLASGGGISVENNGQLTMTNSIISGNRATNGGGGLRSGSSTKVYLENSEISGNQVLEINGFGGGLFVASEVFQGWNLRITGNLAGNDGGGVYTIGSGQFLLGSDFSSCDPKALPPNTYCSELRDNQAGLNATADGGGLYGAGSSAELIHTAVINNSASGSGEALYATTVLTLAHSIIRDNLTTGYAVHLDNGSLQSTHNTYAGNYRAMLIDGGTADLQGNIAWGNSGGIVLSNSPTVNAACNNTQGAPLAGAGNISQDPLFITNAWGDYHLDVTSPSVDQCAFGGGVDLVNTIAPQGLLADMGAFEAYTSQIFNVDDNGTESDSLNGDSICETAAGVCTLEAAVEEANSRPVQDAIVIPIGTFPANDLLITEQVIITGNQAGRTFLDGSIRAFITGIASRPGMQISISNLTIFDGDAGGGNGGGILNNSNLTLDNVYIRENLARNGGAVYNNPNATLTIQNSTMANNIASWTFLGVTNGNGGGIYNASSQSVNLTNVTVSNNKAADNGGGILHNGSGAMTLLHVTVVENAVTEPGASGGGMANNGAGTFTIQHALVGNNLDISGDGPDCFGAFINPLTAANIVEGALSPGCSWNSTPIRTDPNVGPLTGANGGQTPTHALLPGAVAIDLGYPAICTPTDQRGYPRVNDCDLGAYEYNATPTAITLIGVNIGSGDSSMLAIISVLMLLLAGVTLYIIRRGSNQ